MGLDFYDDKAQTDISFSPEGATVEVDDHIISVDRATVTFSPETTGVDLGSVDVSVVKTDMTVEPVQPTILPHKISETAGVVASADRAVDWTRVFSETVGTSPSTEPISKQIETRDSSVGLVTTVVSDKHPGRVLRETAGVVGTASTMLIRGFTSNVGIRDAVDTNVNLKYLNHSDLIGTVSTHKRILTGIRSHDKTAGISVDHSADKPGEVTGNIIDDWADDPTISDGATDRKTFSELNYQETEPSSSDHTATTRKTWDEDHNTDHSINANNELEVSNGVWVTSSSQLDNMTWEWSMQNDDDRQTTIIPLSQDDGWDGGWRLQPNNGYEVRQKGDSITFEYTSSGSATSLISGSWPNDTSFHTVKLTRDGSGGWELFVDGTSQGTANDTTYSESDKVETAIAGGSQAGTPLIAWFEEY